MDTAHSPPEAAGADREDPLIVGRSMPRKEDTAFLTGTARYVDDLRLPRMLHLGILRSRTAHARLKSVDYSSALRMPGVHGALSGKDLVGKVKPWGDMTADLLVGDHFVFATDKIVYEGQEIAAVVAETRYQALDALETIEVATDELPVYVDPESAMQPGAERIQPAGNYAFGEGNVFDRWRVRVGDIAEVERDADLVVQQRFVTNRQACAAMEPHGCLADYDSFTGVLTFYASTQSIYMIRDGLADALQLARNKIRVIVPNVGGAFGSKGQLFAHEVIAAIFSMRLGRPVHCLLSRSDVFKACTARNAQVRHAELFLKRDGLIIGYRDYIIHNCGAFSAWGNQVVRIGTNVGMLPYPIPNIQIDADCVHTNTTCGGPVRGFGIPQTLWAKEQLVDMAADALQIDPLDIRLLNVIKSYECPVTTPMGQIVDSTTAEQCLEKVAAAIGWREKRARKTAWEGVGMALAMKYTGARHPSVDTDLSAVRLRLETDGTVTIYSSDVNHGQGHATFLAQIVADIIGVGFEKVRLAPPDSASSPFGLGTFGSRSAAILGTACRLAAERLRERLFQIAAYVLEESPDNLQAGRDRVFRRGLPDTGIWLENLAGYAAYRTHQLPPGFEPTLEASATYDTATERERPDGTGNLSITYSATAHAAHIRIDEETGRLMFLDYAIASDSGVVINPLIVAGQHHGSFMFGLGMALGEEYKYDDQGHLLNASFSNYAMPRATDVPEITKLFEIPAPSLTIPGGHKGAGESSTGPVPATLANAIADAIGVRFTELPITAEKILLALREKERRQVKSFRFPDDMPSYAGPQGVADWPRPPAEDDLGLLL